MERRRKGSSLIEKIVEAEKKSEELGREALILQKEIEVAGRKITLARLDLGDLAELEEKFGSFEKFGEALAQMPIREFLYLLFLSMRKIRPAITVEEVGKHFPIDVMFNEETLKKIREALGLEAFLQTAPKASREPPSLGQESSPSSSESAG